MATLSRVDVEPLLEALRDPSPETRLAVLDALTRLSLDPDGWFAVREYAAWALDDKTAPEHLDVLEPAARVPIRSLRRQIAYLAAYGEPEERRRAAFALAEVGDEEAVEPLVALLDEAPDAGRLLARLDVSSRVAEVRPRAAAESGDRRFWLALALARAGDDAELVRTIRELDEGRLTIEFLWGDPSVAAAEFARGPALQEPVRERVRAEADTLTGDGGRLARLLLEASEEQPEAPVEESPQPPEPPAATDELRALTRAAFDTRGVFDAEGRPSPEWRSAVEAAVADVAAASDPRTAWSLAISELFRRVVERPEQTLFFGNEIAALVHELHAFAPDVWGLLDAYRPLAAAGGTGGVASQIAWTAARGGLGYLVRELAPRLALPEERLAAARLVAEAADYAAAGPPVFGGAPPRPRARVRAELIDDMVAANGGGRRRRLDDVAREDEEPLEEAAPPEPSGAQPRWILTRVSDTERPDVPLRNAFRAGGTHEIAVAIGPEQEGFVAAAGGESFDEALGPAADQEQLFVAFIPPPSVSPPQSGSLFLPSRGTSRPCTFAVRIPPELETFEAQIQVHHGNRMVQMALLRGPVVPDPERAGPDARIELELAVIRPGTDLGGRKRFDLGLARTGAATTGVADEALAVFDDDRIDGVVTTLRQILTKIATSEAARAADLEADSVVDDLLALAFQGVELHKAIAGPLADLGGRPLDRVQVLVESASDFFPVEVVYDLPTPKLRARLCPGWKKGLQTGKCPESHAPKGPRGLAEHVCPTGFWAVSKVIERQVVGKESWSKLGVGDAEFVLRPHPTAERRSLEPPQVVLFAASDKVDGVKRGQIAGVRKTLERIADEAAYAETWDGWVEAVGRRSPSLLVLLSHTEERDFQAGLEVGAGDLCLISQIESPYVRSSDDRSPVVLLLGCETAVTDFGLQTFVARFQDLGAALVVGTVASVLGQRAAPVARTIVTDLAAASKRRKPISAGDLLLGIRRKLLAKGELTALCLTAFGDADWQLGGA